MQYHNPATPMWYYHQSHYTDTGATSHISSSWYQAASKSILECLFVCVEVLQPSQPNGVMWSMVSLPTHKFTGQAYSSKQLTSTVQSFARN